MIPQDFIQQLLDRTDIVALVERYVPLKKAGANYQARCPFHNEKTPSFSVSPSKQFYHCFGCGAHGTAITFLMEHAGYSFIDAVKELAGQVGMPVPDDGKRVAPEEDNPPRKAVRAHGSGRAPLPPGPESAEPAIAYLKKRGVTGETAARFALGYAADDWQPLAAAFADYQDPLLVEAGLVISNEGKRYDRFRDRVMFPIRNERGQVIAFGGRVMAGRAEIPQLAGDPPVPQGARTLRPARAPPRHPGRRPGAGGGGLHGCGDAGPARRRQRRRHPGHRHHAGPGRAPAASGGRGDLRLRRRQRRPQGRLARPGKQPAQARDGKLLSFLFLPEGEDPDSFVRARARMPSASCAIRPCPCRTSCSTNCPPRPTCPPRKARCAWPPWPSPYHRQAHPGALLTRALRQRLGALTGLEAPRSARDSRQHTSNYPSDKQADFQARRPQGRSAVQPSAWRVVLQAVLHDPARAGTLPELPESAQPEAQNPARPGEPGP
jgi:hypothetical protein